MEVQNPSIIVDHIYSNIRDNRRRMLRLTDQAGNMRNAQKRKNTTSQFLGISRVGEKWNISVRYNGILVYLLCVDLPEELAARQRDLFIKLKGYDHRLNFNDWDTDGVVEYWRTKLNLVEDWPNV